MDKRKDPMKASNRQEKKQEEEEESGHITPGVAEGDLETIEQDLAQQEEGGPAE